MPGWLWFCWVACGGPAPSPPSPDPVPEAIPGDPEPTPARPAPTDPDPTFLLEVAAGRRAPTALVDPKRGFVLIEVDESAPDDPRADRRGRVREAQRWCGEAAETQVYRLAEDLANRTQDGSTNVFRCEGPVCVHPPQGPDDAAGSYAFQAPEGQLVLGVVVRMTHPPASDAAQAKVEAWVSEQVNTLVSQDCPK